MIEKVRQRIDRLEKEARERRANGLVLTTSDVACRWYAARELRVLLGALKLELLND